MPKFKFQLKALFITALIMFLFPFCKGESDSDPSIDLTYQDITFPYTAASNTVFVETNMDWTATVSENWCTLSVTSGGKGNTGLKIFGNGQYNSIGSPGNHHDNSWFAHQTNLRETTTFRLYRLHTK